MSSPKISDQRARILASTRALFGQNGYAGTTTRQILAAAGVANGALYHAFENGKPEIAGALYEQAARALRDALSEKKAPKIASEYPKPEALIKSLVGVFFTWREGHQDLAGFMAEMEACPPEDPARPVINSARKALHDLLWDICMPIIGRPALNRLPAPLLEATILGPAKCAMQAWGPIMSTGTIRPNALVSALAAAAAASMTAVSRQLK